ncbi:MAG: adenine phosphoribosyltransferase [Nitrospinae bacterium]|nr:adenine phosphoribosyltransferase [Nitrospinota bacterium]
MAKLSAEELERRIRLVPDFPKKGILFLDVTTVFNDAEAFKSIIDTLAEKYAGQKIDHVAGVEARGLVIAAALAYRLGCGMTMIRKPGKLPADTISESYALEYGTNEIQMHKDAFKPGERVLLVDDLLATGGTMRAAISLTEKLGAKVVGVAFVVELCFLSGAEKFNGYELYSMIKRK